MLGRNDIKFNFWQKYKNTKMNSSTDTKHIRESRENQAQEQVNDDSNFFIF